MKIYQIKYGPSYKIDLIPALDGKEFNASKVVGGLNCHLFDQRGETFISFDNGKERSVVNVKGRTKGDEQEINLYIQDQSSCLAFIAFANKQELVLEYRKFSQAYSFSEPIGIGLGDLQEEDLRKRFAWAKGKWEEIIKSLSQRVCIDIRGGKKAILVTQGPSNSELSNSFRVIGNGVSLDVFRNREGKYEVRRAIKAEATLRDRQYPVILLKGKITFEDISFVAEARKEIEKELRTILSSGESYIQLWEEYNRLEEEDVREKVGQLKFIRISHWKRNTSARLIEFYGSTMDQLRDWAKEIKQFGLALEYSQEKPDLDLIMRKPGVEESASADKPQRHLLKLEGFEPNRGCLLLKPINDIKTDLPQEGYLFGSMLGDQVRLKRRRRALELMRTARVAMPSLSLILEEKPVSIREVRSVEAISPTLRQRLPVKLNPKQVQALKIALNTPDIALIQGPPGTGKTQVISALCERLVELAKENDEPIGKMTLLSSYQHDAVVNMATRTQIYGLPAIKIGRKGEGIDPVGAWTQEVLGDIKAELDQLGDGSKTALLKEIWQSKIMVSQNREDHQLIKEELKRIRKMVRPVLSAEKMSTMFKLTAEELDTGCTEQKSRKSPLERAVQSIRVTRTGWEDDGPKQLTKAGIRLARESISLTDGENDLLESLENKSEEEIPTTEEFEALREFQDRILNLIAGKTREDRPLDPWPAADQFYDQMLEEISEQQEGSEEGVKVALEEYLDDLEFDPQGTFETIVSYSALLAATVQGSDSKPVHQLKEDGDPDFNSVIVDEAARANPLDLFVALAKGKRRVILVGDHRQLPQLLEHHLEKRLVEEQTGKQSEQALREVLRKSLFERLFNSLKDQEKIDGCQRTITLNKQYRMHPVIGNFVSQTFYERHQEDPIQSETEAENLQHGLSKFKGKQVAWIAVHNDQGQEIKGKGGNSSISRGIEAKILVRYLAEAIEENPDLSFGVITFYRQQVQEILEECLKINPALTQKNEVGEWKISQNYQGFRGKAGERLRIGSVDAFQGKEFDVVLLSTVRSNTVRISSGRRGSVREKYGFLTLENRLNVAMSRAKRLLIAVGDPDMFSGEKAGEHVYGLKAFYDLTGTEHGKRID